MTFTERLWDSIAVIYQRTLHHPFLQGLVDGSLPESAFRYYVVQDSHYLKDYARGLALLGAKAPDDEVLRMFCLHAANAIDVERALHSSFFSDWGLTESAVAATPVAPNCMLYTNYLLRVAYERPYHEALGAFLPCYWIYWEVGKALQARGSSHAAYRKWIGTYASEEFGTVVRQVLQAADAVADELTERQRQAMRQHFVLTSRMEYLFWDMGYHQQVWGV